MTELQLRNTQGLRFSNFIFLPNNIELISRTLSSSSKFPWTFIKTEVKGLFNFSSTSNSAHTQSECLGVTVRHFCYLCFRSFYFIFIYVYYSAATLRSNVSLSCPCWSESFVSIQLLLGHSSLNIA